MNSSLAFDADVLRRDAPDAHWTEGEGTGSQARCSVWWRAAGSLAGEKVGLIGHYRATDASGSRRVLEQACRTLAREGCTLAVGPMDGSAWRRYRLVTERGKAPPFFLEPDNPDDWPGHFRAAGFEPIASYTSAWEPLRDDEDPRLARAERRLAEQGVTIRAVDMARFDEDLRRGYAVATVAFRRNFLYTDISEQEFLEQYRLLKAAVKAELAFLAMDGVVPVGFMLALPDLAQSRRGETLSQVVMKTAAILPGRAYAGLGTVLMGRAKLAARRLGFKAAIHALMHDANSSRNWSRGASVLRRYALFARRLGPGR